MIVRPKKYLGQHFLVDNSIAEKIVQTFDFSKAHDIVEIGAGMGVLSAIILKNNPLTTIEIDEKSCEFLREYFSKKYLDNFHIIQEDFLKVDLNLYFSNKLLAIVGNFPYNISSQIVFKVLQYRNQIPFFGGMFQKEVAERICAGHGKKTYGILSVLVNAFYNTQYEFTVYESAFSPPPKVKSGVISMTLKTNVDDMCNHRLFFSVVKAVFNQRRKMLSNSLKSYNLPNKIKAMPVFKMRPEQLSVEDFINLVKMIHKCQNPKTP